MERALKMRTWTGLAPKLIVSFAVVVVMVAVSLITVAGLRLKESMTRSFESKGEAISLALAAASEQSIGADVSIVQGSVDANKVIDDVLYIYIEDEHGRVLVHTFSPTFPSGLSERATVGGQASPDGRVRIDPRLVFEDSRRTLQAIDVSAPIASGALGQVHVGMDLDAIDARVRELYRSMALAGGIIALIGITLCLLFTQIAVVRPIRELTRVTRQIVDKGDLTQKISVKSRDEVGELASTFASMVAKLREIPQGVRESTRLLADSVSQLDATTRDQVQTITRQATALQETQVTAQEIKQTSRLAAEKAETVLKYAERADAIGRSGEAAVQQSLRALTEIRAQVAEIAERITSLGEKTIRIDDVTQTVKDLADQSNMLALNAAIEAVRSGEHGKGFAVVAREIRSLADQSIQATRRAREMLGDISGAVHAAVSITEKGSQRIDAGLSEVRILGDRLTDLLTIVKENAEAVRQISAAVGQQNAGISQIFAAVTDQTEMMENTRTRLGGAETSVKVIGDVSGQLVQIVGQFRI